MYGDCFKISNEIYGEKLRLKAGMQTRENVD